MSIWHPPVKRPRAKPAKSRYPRGQLKEVVHIEDVIGKDGGASWSLTLECGHKKTVRRPSYKGREYKLLTMKPSFAPKRSRCWVCLEDQNG